MLLVFDDRPSTSPLIERVWRSRSEGAGRFSSIASPLWEMVVSRVRGTTVMTIRGPETRATDADCPADGEWLGIRFRFGTFMPQIPVGRVLDRNDVDLPHVAPNAFWLDGRAWEYPSWENAETFVQQLVRHGLIGHEPLVDAALYGREELSTRSTQRRFLRATGLTRGAHRQIVRARHVTRLLQSGAAIADAAHDAGYFDQAHLTRSVKRLIGQTPGQIARGETPLSFLYKTTRADGAGCAAMSNVNRTGLVMSGLPALFLLVDGVMKLFEPAVVVDTTVQLGFPEGVIVPLGVVLLVSTVLYLVPRTAVLGAILLTGYLGGAVATHVRVGEGAFPILFPVIIGALLWGGLVLRDPRLAALLPLDRR